MTVQALLKLNPAPLKLHAESRYQNWKFVSAPMLATRPKPAPLKFVKAVAPATMTGTWERMLPPAAHRMPSPTGLAIWLLPRKMSPGFAPEPSPTQ
jgi:hypothetical protein